MNLKTLSIIFVGALIAQFLVFANFYGTVFCRSFLAEIVEGVLIDLANTERSRLDVESLETNSLLNTAAQLKAEDMAQKSYFAHTSPEGITPWHWFAEVGYYFNYAGENLAVNFTDSNVLHQAWINSVKHRQNIVNERFTEIGIGKAEGIYKGRPATFVVQLFGNPKNSNTLFSVQEQLVVGAPGESRLLLENEDSGETVLLETIQQSDVFVSVKDSSIEDVGTVEGAQKGSICSSS